MFLRTITRSKWYKHSKVPWLAQDMMQADALGELKTKGNTLSVWQIDDGNNNLEQVITALAAGRDYINKLDYVLFDPTLLTQIDIKTKVTDGDSVCPQINRTGWHHELIELPAYKLFGLALCIMKEGFKDRYQEIRIESLVLEAVRSGTINIANCRDTMQQQITRLLSGI